MSAETLAAIIAFLALGVNLTAMIFKLFLDPRSRSLRWFALFELDLMAWLGVQGWIFARGEVGALGPVFEGAVHMLPGLFLASTLVDVRGWSNARAAALVLASAALMPITLGELVGPPGGSPLVLVWQIFGWLTGAVLQVRDTRRPTDPRVRRRMRAAVAITLMVIGPIAVVVGWLSGGEFFTFVMPLLTIAIQVLIVFGIVHLRFYDIEVRSLRTGETAGRAAELERLAVAGELAASFAHEVRNPLTGVRSLAQRLAEDDLAEDRRRQYADVIVREVGRVEQIVSNLLGLARRAPEPEREAPGSTPLSPLFEDVTLLVGARARGKGVAVDADAGDLAARASREALAQVLLNLLLNAIDHTPPGGRVQLAARRDGVAGVEIRVRDQGPGIPAGDRTRVFEPLYSGSGGTGLGLAVVRRVAGERGWKVALADAPGGGAEFRIGVPA